MTEFFTPADIGNRALQHLGQRQMSAALGFAEPSKNAIEIAFVYGKLRRAELTRNAWRFAIREAALRPVDANTLRVNPALWGSGTTYFRGSLVTDQSGTPWISRIGNNIGNQPGTVAAQFAWEPYFGPLTVSLYDSSQSYFPGELVYTAAGDGTYNTYLSLVTGNAVHPALPDQWASGTTYFKNQVVQQFPAWASGTTYAAGAGVLYTDGNVYASLAAGNVGNTPSTASSKWAPVPVLVLTTPQVPVGPSPAAITASPVLEWAAATGYGRGAVVMFNAAQYVSIAAGTNTGNYPNAAGSTSWAAVTGGALTMSLIDLNIGNSPATTAVAAWASGTTYATGNQVTGSDGLIYTSVGSGNLGHDPTLDAVHTFWTTAGKLSPWTTVFTLGGGNAQWLQIGGAAFPGGVALTTLGIAVYPLGSGPLEQSTTRNIFRLPANFLKRAPQDPKAGSTSWLGAPSGHAYDDWTFRGNFLLSASVQPIVLQFVADVTDVTLMDDMFCEGLAARIAQEACETLTQSTAKLADVTAAYTKAMGEARLSNAILVGSEEPAEDDYITCRF